MRKIWKLALAAAGAVLLAAPLGAAAVEIPAGTHVLLRMMNSISTRTAQPGDYVYLRTMSPITAGGRIVVPVNSYVQGVVTHVKRPGRVRGRAELAIRLETLTLRRGRVLKFAPRVDSLDAGASGQKVDKEENQIRQAPTKGQDAGRIAILAGSGASIGGIADRSWKGAGIGAGIGAGAGLVHTLLTRGRELVLRRGSTLDVVLDRPVVLK